MHVSRIEALEQWKLLSAGDVDPLFGLVENNVPKGYEAAAAVVVDDAGRATVIGNWQQRLGGRNTGLSMVSLARYRYDGSLDTSFGQAGTELIAPHGMSGVSSVRRQPDGKLLLGGSRYDAQPDGSTLLRLMVARVAPRCCRRRG